MANWENILKKYLLGLFTFIGILVLIVGFKQCNTNKISEHGTEPANENVEKTTKQIPEFKITGIELLDSCKIRVKTSLDGIFPERRSVRISIRGRNNNGTYQSHSIFNAENIRKIDIWAIYGNDTIPYEGNGKEFRGKGCP